MTDVASRYTIELCEGTNTFLLSEIILLHLPVVARISSGMWSWTPLPEIHVHVPDPLYE